MSEQRIHVYMPSEDGEYVPIKFTSPEKDLIKDNVLIFVDDEEKSIYIWTGTESPVRKRFISSQIARQMRLEKGLTHRVSTEEQGNETEKFLQFIEKTEGIEIKASTLLEVSPPPGAADLPTDDSVKIKTHPKNIKSVSKSIKSTEIESKTIELEEKKITPPPSPTSAAIATKKPEKLKPIKTHYYCKDEVDIVPITKTKLIFPAYGQNLTLKTVHISTASTEDKILLFSTPKVTKTTTCKSETPILVIYLKSNISPIIELDDLNIPIPAGNSIYYSCPANTFIGLSLN